MEMQMKFNAQDEAMLHALDDDFKISDNETAAVTGEMRVTVTRPADDRLWLRLTFPGGEVLDIRMARAQLLEELNIKTNDS
jgi:hypothetical protein